MKCKEEGLSRILEGSFFYIKVEISSHDVLWIAWKALGEYMGGEPLDWLNGLKSNIVRNAIADCFEIVCRNDERILGNLKDAY